MYGSKDEWNYTIIMLERMMKKMKKEYVEPEMEIIEFETEDIITTSGGIGLPEDPLSVQAVQPFSLE